MIIDHDVRNQGQTFLPSSSSRIAPFERNRKPNFSPQKNSPGFKKNSKVSEVTWCSLTNSTPMTIWKGLKFVPPHLYGLTRYSYKPWLQWQQSIEKAHAHCLLSLFSASFGNVFNHPLKMQNCSFWIKPFKAATYSSWNEEEGAVSRP